MTVSADKLVAVVVFPSGYKDYHFKNHIEDLSIKDKVVCDTVNGYVVGEVKGFKSASTLASKHLVQKVDLSAHLVRLEQEKKDAAKLKEITKLKNDMEKRRQKIQDVQVYAILAQSDPVMADMLSKLTALTEGN